MAKTKHGIFQDMGSLNMDESAGMAEQDHEQLQMIRDTDAKVTKNNKAAQ